MKRIIILIITLIFNINSYSQKQKYIYTNIVNQDTIYALRVPDNKINSYASNFIRIVQIKLEDAKINYQKKLQTNIDIIPTMIKSIQQNDKDWNINYYQNEYNIYQKWNQKLYSDEEIKKEIAQAKKDSINKIAQAEQEKELLNQKHLQEQLQHKNDSLKKIEKTKKDSINKSQNPYRELEYALDEVNYLYFTVFIGLDFNFSNSRLGLYLQDKLSLVPKDFNNNGSVITETYIPQISYSKNDLFYINYWTKEINKRSSAPTNNGKCTVVTKCEISGPEDLIIKLFLWYWPNKIKLESFKPGEIATYTYLGDKITLFGIQSPNIYKIIIEQSNIGIDYYKLYHIE